MNPRGSRSRRRHQNEIPANTPTSISSVTSSTSLSPPETSDIPMDTEMQDLLPDITPNNTETAPTPEEQHEESTNLPSLEELVSEVSSQQPTSASSETLDSRFVHFGVLIEFPETPESATDEPLFTQRQRTRRLLIVFRTTEDTGNVHDLLNHLFQLYEPKGPPPASKRVLDSLPTITVDLTKIGENCRCCVCFDDFEEGAANVVSLPCSHLFHKDCVSHWLKEHNTCPNCRYELPVDDEEYEAERKKRMSSRNIDESSFFTDTSETKAETTDADTEENDESLLMDVE